MRTMEVVVVMKGQVMDGPAPDAPVLAEAIPGAKYWVDPERINRGFFPIIEPEDFAGQPGWIRISFLAPTGKSKGDEDTEPVRKET